MMTEIYSSSQSLYSPYSPARARLPASLMNFSITSGEQSLHVFTATLTFSPICLLKAVLNREEKLVPRG